MSLFKYHLSFQWFIFNSDALTDIKYYFIFFNSALNPFIYGYNNQTMQKAFRITFTWLYKDKVKFKCFCMKHPHSFNYLFSQNMSWGKVLVNQPFNLQALLKKYQKGNPKSIQHSTKLLAKLRKKQVLCHLQWEKLTLLILILFQVSFFIFLYIK